MEFISLKYFGLSARCAVCYLFGSISSVYENYNPNMSDKNFPYYMSRNKVKCGRVHTVCCCANYSRSRCLWST